ncbi:MAG: glycosyltransferase [Lachnospiraceae bacterium]|nr:glycosyltransferase [Lachnospiraceae bacterium]
MSKIRKIIAFSKGDSRQCSTWSNVPYYFLKNIEKKGIKVVRVNLQWEDDSAFAKKVIKFGNALIRHSYRLLQKGSTAMNTIDRLAIYEKVENRRIKEAINQNPDADIALFFDYSHSLKTNNSIKVALFCDWTIAYEIKNHQNRVPNHFEKKAIHRQYQHMEQSDCIITLFPNVYAELVKHFGREKVYYLGNVINAEMNTKLDQSIMLAAHYNSNRVLMIGRKAYKEGLIQLAESVKIYNEGKPESHQLLIDVIGMTEKETGLNDDHIIYYGYLNKNNTEQKNTYYNLIQGAKVICNTTENWVGISSIIEAMYWKLPVIINPTEDIYKTFGQQISFGRYVEKNDSAEIGNALKWILELDRDSYSEVCEASYKAVKDFTWEGYVERIVETFETL